MIERLRLQQERVSYLSAAVESIRSNRAHLRNEIEQAKRYQEQLDERLRGEFDPERLQGAEREQAMIDQRLEMLENRMSQLDLEESEKLSELEREREAADEIRDRLDELDRQLEEEIEQSEEN